jgi:carbon-monoxide dehydrogenase medium subunit
MQDFEYHSPESISDACELLKEHNSSSQVLAGGTDLIPRLYHGDQAVEHIINIKNIPELSNISFDTSNGLELGPLVTLNDLIYSEVIRLNYPILSEIGKSMASHQIRNLATIGGNLCNAAPSADTAPILIALDAKVILTGPNNKTRNLSLEQFFTGPGQTAMEQGELLTSIHVPSIDPCSGMDYIKHGTRNALEIAVVGVAGLVKLDPKTEKCKDSRVVIASCAPTPLRIPSAEKVLNGQKLSDGSIAKAAKLAAENVKPITDVRACDTYRREMVQVQCRRVLENALAQASQKTA